MRKFPSTRYPKKGSVLIVIICVFVVLGILFASFLKSTSSRMYTTKKLTNTLLAREFANSLAILANHYIKNVLLNDSSSELRKFLSLPLEDTKSKSYSSNSEKNKFNDYFKSKMQNGTDNILDLLQKNSGLKNNLDKNHIEEKDWSLEVFIDKGDFTLENNSIKVGDQSPHSREKFGKIKVKITVNYIPPGTKSSVSEDYYYTNQVRVVANILPVLSKFTLYVKDVYGGSTPSSTNGKITIDNISPLNVVSTKPNGDLDDEKVRPWILNNGGENLFDTYNDFITKEKGLVYLGGGTKDNPIYLCIARGWDDEDTPEDAYGEDFHFFKQGNGKGYWKTVEIWEKDDAKKSSKGLMRSDIGFCRLEDSSQNENTELIEWQRQYELGLKDESKYNSIFRLYGVDGKESPTLVYGFVDSLCISVRLYKKTSMEYSSEKKKNVPNVKTFLLYHLFRKEDGGEEIFNWATGKDKNDNGGNDNDVSSSILNILGGYQNLGAFCSDYEDKYGEDSLTFDEYQKICTGLFKQRYNKDYTYYFAESKGASPEERDYPIERGLINDQQLKDICDENSSFKFSKIPNIDQKAEYGKIYPDKDSDNSLDDLDAFLDPDKLLIPNPNPDDSDPYPNPDDYKRIAYIVKFINKKNLSYKYRIYNNCKANYINLGNISSSDNYFYNFLKYRNLVYEDKDDDKKIVLDFNGWIFVDNSGASEDKLTLDFNSEYPKTKVVSHGGIILQNGDIYINSDINSEGGHLTIIAKNGNIYINPSVKQIDASLVAGGGQVILEGDGKNQNKLTVKGNIVMKSIEIDNKKCKGLDRGMTLEYNTNLSVIPFTRKNNLDEKDYLSEKSMLMFDIKENSILFD